jgi:hypothetical protein
MEEARFSEKLRNAVRCFEEFRQNQPGKHSAENEKSVPANTIAAPANLNFFPLKPLRSRRAKAAPDAKPKSLFRNSPKFSPRKKRSVSSAAEPYLINTASSLLWVQAAWRRSTKPNISF